MFAFLDFSMTWNRFECTWLTIYCKSNCAQGYSSLKANISPLNFVNIVTFIIYEQLIKYYKPVSEAWYSELVLNTCVHLACQGYEQNRITPSCNLYADFFQYKVLFNAFPCAIQWKFHCHQVHDNRFDHFMN